MTVHTGRVPMPQMARRTSAASPVMKPTANSPAPSMPNASSGFWAKRSSNQTESMSRTPIGIRPRPNFDRPACLAYNGTGISVTVNPCAWARTIMYRCQSGRAGCASMISRRYAFTLLRSRTGTLNSARDNPL